MNELEGRVQWQSAQLAHPYAVPSSYAASRASSALSTASSTSSSTVTTTTTAATSIASSAMARQQHYDQPGQHSPPRAHQPPATAQSPSARQSTAPSSRRALTHALELAQVAVRLDAQNDDPSGAIYAYARSVSLLNHVMNSVMRGDDDSVRRRSGRRRSSVSARQDEINRLRAIHDTYAERMRILSQIYGIPIIELTPEEAFNPPEQRHEFGEGAESIGTAMLESASAQSPLAAHNPQTQHAAPRAVSVPRNDPYAVSPTTPTPQQQSALPPAVPAPVQHHHSHSASRISEVPPPRPPPSGPLPSLPGDMGHPASAAPPPLGPLPHPPSFVEPDTPPSGSAAWDFVTSARARAGTGASIAQAASGLGSLLEEPDTARAPVQAGAQRQQYSYAYPDDGSAASSQQQRYSPPLPPVPQQRESMPPRPSTPHSASQMTPRQAEPQRPNSGSSRPRARSGSVRSDAPPLPLVGNPSGGSISQRRGNKPPPLPIMSPTPNTTSSGGAPTSSPSSSDHMSPAGSGNVGLGFTNMTSAPVVRVASSLPPMPHQPNNAVRTRAVSQPGHRPSMPPPAHSFPVDTTQSQPPVPRPPMTPSMSSTPGSQIIPARKASYPSSMLSTPYGSSPTIAQQGSSVSLALAQQQQLANPCMPISPQPNQVPTDPLLKPYHLMHALRQSMTSKTGAYLTRRLHIPHEVWNVVHLAKLNAVSDKVGVVEKLARILDEVGTASANFCGFGAPTADPSRDEVERWILKLDEWAAVCEDVVLKDGKKLGVGEGFVARKSGGWGNKFARSFEKMTSNGKNMDSSGNYVAMLSRLFMGAGVLESHTKWFLSTPRGAPYGTLSQDLLQQLDMRLRRSSEFFAKVVLTFVIRDLAQLLDRHAKNGEKWLAQ